MREPTSQKRPRRFSLRLEFGTIFLGLFFLASGILGTAFYFIHTLRGDAQAINYAGQERYRSYQLAFLTHRYILEEAATRPEIRKALLEKMKEFEAILYGLRDGDPARDLLGVKDDPHSTYDLYDSITRHIDDFNTTIGPFILRVIDATSGEVVRTMADDYSELVPRYVNDIDRTVKLFEESSRDKLYRFRTIEFVLIGVVAGVMGGSIFLVTFLIINPLAKITNAATKLAGGDLEYRVKVTRKDEIGVLASAFNTMAEQLGAFTETLEQRATELAKTNEELQAEITQRKQAQEKLRQVVEELERSNEELQQFAYVASHDLQEPLRMVESYTNLLAQRYEGKLTGDTQEFMNYIVEGAVRMKGLINDLLLYSRVGTHGKPFELTDCDTILEKVIQLNLQAAIEETGAVVTHDKLPTVMADSTQLSQLFQNLIGNSIKFRTKEGAPRIHVSAEGKENESVFSVKDNGIGIDPKYFERIFTIFQRLHTRAQYPGSGVGLAICRRIVERHGGRIWVESEPGKGSTFYFTILIRR